MKTQPSCSPKYRLSGAVRLALGLVVCLPAALLQVWAQTAKDNAVPVIENERVTVREITLDRGKVNPMERHEHDFVTLFLVVGKIRTTDANSKSIVALRRTGSAIFGRKGAEETLEVVSGGPARLIVVELKDDLVPPVTNSSGYPNAFPRPGSKKVLDNDRVTVWNYAWTKSVPTRMHYHDKDAVVVYMEDGSLKSTTPDGKNVVNDYTSDTIHYIKRGNAHFEELVKGKQSAIMLELK